MRPSRPKLASKRPAFAPVDPYEMYLASRQMQIEPKREEREEQEAPMKTRKRTKASPVVQPPSTPPSTSTPSLHAEKTPGLPDRLGSLPLRCVLTGTNPSETAWKLGHAYAHRSNRFWPLVHSSPGIIPRAVSLLDSSSNGAAKSENDGENDGEEGEASRASSSPFSGTATDDELLNEFAGLGLCDVGTGHPGTDLSSISSAAFAAWVPFYYSRLVEHVRRAAGSVGCRCRIPEEGQGEEDDDEEEEEGKQEGEGGGGRKSSSPPPSFQNRRHHPSTCCAPLVVAFTGKRQFVELLNAERDPKAKNKKRVDSSSVGYGLQPRSLRPAEWPHCLSEAEIWVLTTTSGAAGLSNEARAAPYLELGKRLEREGWPRPLPACVASKGGGGG